MKFFDLISVVVTCILLNSVNASQFQCTDEPEICKTRFGKQFEKDFKELHLIGSRKLFRTYINKANIIKSKLPADDPHVKALEESINVVTKSLQKLNDNKDDNTKTVEAIKEAMNGMTLNSNEVPDTEEFKQLTESENVIKSLTDVIQETSRNAGNLWADMYSGLTEKDLKAYPEYAEVNKFMEALRGNAGRPAKGSDFINAAAILAEGFDLPFFKAAIDLS